MFTSAHIRTLRFLILVGSLREMIKNRTLLDQQHTLQIKVKLLKLLRHEILITFFCSFCCDWKKNRIRFRLQPFCNTLLISRQYLGTKLKFCKKCDFFSNTASSATSQISRWFSHVFHKIAKQRIQYTFYQCWGSGSACFWATRILLS